MKCTFWVA